MSGFSRAALFCHAGNADRHIRIRDGHDADKAIVTADEPFLCHHSGKGGISDQRNAGKRFLYRVQHRFLIILHTAVDEGHLHIFEICFYSFRCFFAGERRVCICTGTCLHLQHCYILLIMLFFHESPLLRLSLFFIFIIVKIEKM